MTANQRHKKYRVNLRTQALLAYSPPGTVAPCCLQCGSTEHLCLDHVHGQGIEHRRELLNSNTGGWKFYRALRQRGFPKSPALQVLCQACNLKKPRGPYGQKRQEEVIEECTI